MGAWYTPMALVSHVVEMTVGSIRPGQVVRVLDPACGDGRFLFEAARVIRHQGGVPVLTGADIDLGGLATAGSSAERIEAICADSLSHDWARRHFDVVIGNPPFLSQMSAVTVRAGGSAFGGGPYADAAADFLALSVQRARPDGGRVGLVLPLSLLTARDAGPIRAAANRDSVLRWFWWSPDPVFDAAVRTCAIGLERLPLEPPKSADRGACHVVSRTTGIAFAMSEPVAVTERAEHWGWLIADSLGLPPLPSMTTLSTNGTISDRALVTANFRDQYYGLVGAVSDDHDGPPLITTGLIDVARCHWGSRPTRFAKQQFLAPRVERSGLAPFMQRWIDRCLVPKVLVATQTRVLEAVADPLGEWLPAVPVIRVVPIDSGDSLDLFGSSDPSGPVDVWAIAAVLTSPVASALVAGQSAGSGLSATTVRVSQRTLGALPWPAGNLQRAVASLRDGDIAGCGRLVDAAYGLDERSDRELFEWWWRRASIAESTTVREPSGSAVDLEVL